MSAFPAQRQPQRDFLAYYATLKDEEGEGESLEDVTACDFGESGEEDLDGELDGLIDSGPVKDDEAAHKRLDATRRLQEDKALQALARRFEERAADNVDHSVDNADESSSRRVKRGKAAGRRARAEVQSARRAEEEEEKARAEGVQKHKHDALAALFKAYEAAGLNEPSAPAVETAQPLMAMRSEGRSGETGGAKKRFRIAKKASA